MKKNLLIIFCFHSLLVLGQNPGVDWADYYYFNQQYNKAISLYNQNLDSLNIEQQRNLGFSYMKTNLQSNAVSTYRVITDNNSAGVVDYLTFAQLLPSDSKLANEYREKAKRLYIHQPDILENDSMVYKTRFYSSISTKFNPFPNNTSEDEFAPILVDKLYNPSDHYSDGNKIEFYYVNSSKMKDESSLKLKRIKSESPIYNISKAVIDTLYGEIIEDELFPEGINSNLQEGPASYAPEIEKLFFTRSISKADSDLKYQLNIYQVKFPLEEDIKPIPEPLFDLNGNYSNMHPTYDSKNRWLYFSSDRPGGYGGMDLYRAFLNDDGVFEEPENLGVDINTESDEVFPFIYTQDVLFFSSNRKLGLGKLDPIMATRIIDNRWSIEVLGVPFSSEDDDFGFYLDSTTKLGFISSNRDGGKGKDDNYYFVSKPKISGVTDNYLFDSDTLVKSFDGVIKNDDFLMISEDPLNSLVKKDVVLYQRPNNGTVNLNLNGSFWYIARNQEVKRDTFSYYLESSYSKSKPINVYLERKPPEKLVLEAEPIIKVNYIFRPIFFAFDSKEILNEYKERIDEVVEALNLYPDMVIKINGYTDRRGKSEYNLRLSNQRAKSILAYIKSRIENPERITGIGFGETKVEIKDIKIRVSEEEHQKERRVEFEIVNFNY
tara:strand:- start:21682 stop:23664 length:1983 start_codon:yes stop_codon:yes gene_type:complete